MKLKKVIFFAVKGCTVIVAYFKKFPEKQTRMWIWRIFLSAKYRPFPPAFAILSGFKLTPTFDYERINVIYVSGLLEK